MGSTDGTSRKYKRDDFVALRFQLRLHFVEDQPGIPSKEAANIFAHDVARANFPYRSKHVRPEMSSIVLAFPLSGGAVWLAWESSGEDVDGSSVNSEVCRCDVMV
jgi:hypothetical protein